MTNHKIFQQSLENSLTYAPYHTDLKENLFSEHNTSRFTDHSDNFKLHVFFYAGDDKTNYCELKVSNHFLKLNCFNVVMNTILI